MLDSVGKPKYRVAAGSSKFTGDSFQNFAASLGIGASNLSSGATYGFNPITRNHTLLEWAYRGSWLVKVVVDAVADDMIREGINVESDLPPDKIDVLMGKMHDQMVWERLNETLKWSRLYGGCLAVIMIDGQKPDTPLRVDTVTKDQFKGLMVLDRWMVWPHLDDPVKDLGPNYGMPRFYEVVSDARVVPHMKIHYSRCIRFDGIDLPYWQKMAENYWGLSVIEPLYDRLIAFDSTSQGAAQLVYRAHLRTLQIEKLRELIAFGGDALGAVQEQLKQIRLYQTSEGLTLLDATDKFETHQYAFGGLSDVMIQFAQQLSGAAQIPLVRLFGQSPAGLSATGDADIRNYYDYISSMQEARLRHPVQLLLELVYRSTFGEPLPKGFDFDFAPLWQLADTEKAQICTAVTGAVVQAQQAGVISAPAALKELRQSSKVTGVFTNITDEEIEDAEQAPPPMMMGEPGMGQPMDGEGGGPPPGGPGPGPITGGGPDTDQAPVSGAPGGGYTAPPPLPPHPSGLNTKADLDRRYGHLRPMQTRADVRRRFKVLRRHAVGDDAHVHVWKEEDHPRGQPGNKGQFASSPGGGSDPEPEPAKQFQMPKPNASGEKYHAKSVAAIQAAVKSGGDVHTQANTIKLFASQHAHQQVQSYANTMLEALEKHHGLAKGALGKAQAKGKGSAPQPPTAPAKAPTQTSTPTTPAPVAQAKPEDEHAGALLMPDINSPGQKTIYKAATDPGMTLAEKIATINGYKTSLEATSEYKNKIVLALMQQQAGKNAPGAASVTDLPKPFPESPGQKSAYTIATDPSTTTTQKLMQLQSLHANSPGGPAGFTKKYVEQLLAKFGAKPNTPEPSVSSSPTTVSKPAGSVTTAPQASLRYKRGKELFAQAVRPKGATDPAAIQAIPSLHADTWNKVSPSVRNAANRYSNGWYGKMNSALRDPQEAVDNSVKDAIEHFDEFFESDEAKVTQHVMVMRGETIPEAVIATLEKQLKSGVPTRYTKTGFVSTSAAPSPAFSGNCRLEMVVRKGTPAAGIYPVSSHKSENEVVLRHGQTFEVFEIERGLSGGHTVIRMYTV